MTVRNAPYPAFFHERQIVSRREEDVEIGTDLAHASPVVADHGQQLGVRPNEV
jgi:hypothetical protein